MSSVLGSRKRFLYRVIIYGAAPLLGLFVFLDNPDDLRGRVLGGLAILVGVTAVALFVFRLRDPWGAIRYAVRPVSTLRDVVLRWDASPATGEGELLTSLHTHLRQQLPDLDIAMGDPTDDGVLTLGDEVTVIPAASPLTTEDRDGLVARLEALHSPLESRALVVVLATNGAREDDVDLSLLEGARGVHVVRI